MSSVQNVTDLAAVRLLMRGQARRVLGAFLERENSVSLAARELELDLRAVHRHVLALLNAGLLRLVREEKRAGRPVKVYTAVAPAFFVPFSATEAAGVADLSADRMARFDDLFDRASRRKFEALYHEQSGGREWGLRLYRGPEGQVSTDTAYAGAELVDAGVRWQGPVGLLLGARLTVRLTEAEAKEVQVELIRLIMRLHEATLVHEAQGTGEPFLLRLGLVGVTGAEEAELQLARRSPSH